MFSANRQKLKPLFGAVLVLGLVGASCSRIGAPGQTGGEPGTGGGSTGGAFESGAAHGHTAIQLTSLVPGADKLRVEWKSRGFEDFDGAVALFIGSDVSTLFDGQPNDVDLERGLHIFSGLNTETEYFVGLALAPDSGDPLTPAGPVLSARTGQPFYADPNADYFGADGLSPETAWPAVFLAVFSASLDGGGNVWLAGGSFAAAEIQLRPGVHIYGGFPADFDLRRRSTKIHPTLLPGMPGKSVLKIEAGLALQRVDGLTILGGGGAINGIDLDRTPAQLSGLTIEGCSRGLRLRASAISNVTAVTLVDCIARENNLEGLSLEGPYSVSIEGCSFLSNGQEGLEFGPWIAPAGARVNLTVKDSDFAGNGHEGLDVDLEASPGGGTGGVFEILIEDCEFEQNAEDGCLVDIDYETSPSWRAEIVVRGSRARANRLSGFSFDIDSHAEVLLQRLSSTANGQDGIEITSESHAGLVLVSASALVGNLGQGVHTLAGQVGVALSHCLLAGNGGAGLKNELARATAASCAAHLQTNPFGTARLRGSLDLAGDTEAFTCAALEYRTVLNVSGDELVLDSPLQSALGLATEVAADEVVRLATEAAGARVTVLPMPSAVPLPTRLAIFAGTDSVSEDYEPRPGSALEDAGMAPSSGSALDAGPCGSPQGGAPGTSGLVPIPLFRVTSMEPAWGRPIDMGAVLVVRFAGGTPDPSQLAAGLRVFDASGNTWPVSAEMRAGELLISPPVGGWSAGDGIELHSTLLSSEGGLALIPITLPVGSH